MKKIIMILIIGLFLFSPLVESKSITMGGTWKGWQGADVVYVTSTIHLESGETIQGNGGSLICSFPEIIDGITFEISKNETILRHYRFENTSEAIRVKSNRVVIADCYFKNCTVGINITNCKEILIYDCIFYNCHVGIKGINVSNSSFNYLLFRLLNKSDMAFVLERGYGVVISDVKVYGHYGERMNYYLWRHVIESVEDMGIM